MKKNVDSDLFYFELYKQPKDYFSQKHSDEHNDRFSSSKNLLKNQENQKK